MQKEREKVRKRVRKIWNGRKLKLSKVIGSLYRVTDCLL